MPIIRNLGKDFNEGLMDNLRTISYEETGVQSPFVTKDITDPPQERGVLLQGEKRIDDLVRIGKLIASTPGQKFLFNEALLKQSELSDKLRGNNKKIVGNIIRRVGGTAKHLAQVVSSTLAQVPVNGTGTHFLRGFRIDTYFQDTSSVNSGFQEFFGAGGVEGSTYSLSGAPVPFKAVISDSELASRNTTPNPGDLGKNHIGIKGNLTFPTDIAFYNENNTYYSRQGEFSPNISKGITFPTAESQFIQTGTLPGELGVGKSATGAEDTEGNTRTENPSLILNTFSPNQDNEYIQSKTELNIINAQTGFPIKNPRNEKPFIESGKQTTLSPGDIGISNQQVSGSVVPLVSGVPGKFVLGETKSKNDTYTNILTSNAFGVIPLKDSPPLGLISDLEAIVDNTKSTNDPFEPRSTYTGYRTEDNISILQFGERLDPDGLIPLRVNGIFDSIQATSVPIPINDINSGDYNGLNSSIDNTLKRSSIEDFRSQGQNKSVPKSLTQFTGRQVNTYALNYKDPLVNKETRVGLGNQGKITRSRINYTLNDPDTVDKINALDVSTNKALDGITDNRDLIQLEFQIITPEDTHYLAFRAFLDTFDDNFNAAWSSNKFLGRAENFYTYSGFERSITIGFKIAAATREEMKPLYRKAATLASVTAPTYGSSGRFMRGSIAKVTVGDYIFEQPGIIESVQYTWQTDYPWEISFQNPEGQGRDQILPHVLDVSVSFKVIHDFLPTTGVVPLITNYRPIKDNKDIYIPLKKQELVKTETQKEEDINNSISENNEPEVVSIDDVIEERPTVAIDKTYVNSPKFNPNKDFKLDLQNFNSDNNFKINTSNKRETPKLNLTEEQRDSFAEFGITSFIND